MGDEIIENPFRVLDVLEMTRDAIRDHVDGPWRRSTGIVTKILGPNHVMIHRHGELQPEAFHINVWQHASPEFIEELKKKNEPTDQTNHDQP